MKDKILYFMKEYEGTNGCAPTLQEIAEAVGLGYRSHVYYYLRRLIQEGVVHEERPPGFSRRYTCTDERGGSS